VARAQCDDLAVLKLHPVPDDLTAVKWAKAPARVGEKVTTMAYGSRPRSPESMAFSQGEISGINLTAKLNALLPPASSLIAYQAAAPEGASGAPLIDGKGEAAGVNVLVGDQSGRASDDYLYALSSAYVRRRLAQLRPGGNGAYVGWKSEHRCHDAMAKLAATMGGRRAAMPEDSRGMSMEDHGHER
jgi:S1-C subfamily serine protease